MKLSELPQALNLAKQINICAYLEGSPGIGKSDSLAQYAKEKNLKLVDIRLSQLDPVDFMGLPFPNDNHTKASYLPTDLFPLEGDAKPIKVEAANALLKKYGEETNALESSDPRTIFKPLMNHKNIATEIRPCLYDGWLLVLDELSSCSPAIAVAAYKLILDRLVNTTPIHKDVTIVAAGNKISDAAVAYKLPTALRNRMMVLDIAPDIQSWLKWAAGSNINKHILSYLGMKPEQLHKMDLKAKQSNFPTPRSWAKVAELLQNSTLNNEVTFQCAQGLVGNIVTDLKIFMRVVDKLPTLDQILNNPNSVTIADNSVAFAMTGLIAEHFNKNTAASLMIVLNKLPKNIQMFTLNIMSNNTSRIQELNSIPEFNQWFAENIDLLD